MVVVQTSKHIFCYAKSANPFKNFAVAKKLNSLSCNEISSRGKIVSTNSANFTRSGLFNLTTVNPISVKKFSMAAMKEVEESLDPVQRQSLEEECILLDENDIVVGHDTKRNCHLVRDGNILLHRAFSVFLFNTDGELLLQQRSKSKITFPLMWTNTCCSHPLNVSTELVENEALGVKQAARRRLEIELGIPSQSIKLDDFQYLTRIHYKALSDSIWGEHEIDYILFLIKDVEIDPNPNEIENVRYVSLNNVFNFTKDNELLTPWFRLILESHLPLWWKNLGSLNQFQDHKNILRM